MNAKGRFFTVLCLSLCAQVFAQAQDIDTELSKLAEKLALQIKDAEKTKVTVMDFTDLQGGVTELGKYIAEQLTVDLVINKKGFTLLDRANRDKILRENHLSETGLVNPKTAREFRGFSGVDALILGTITPKNQTFGLTIKVINTETAEIVVATKAEFKSDETVQKLFNAVTASSDTSGGGGTREFSAPFTRQKFTNFAVELESFRVFPNNKISVTMQIANVSKQTTLAFAPNTGTEGGVHSHTMIETSAFDDKGNEIRCTKVNGMKTLKPFGRSSDPVHSGFNAARDHRPQNWMDFMTEVKPGESMHFTLEFAPQATDRGTAQRPKLGGVFKLQSELITIVKSDYTDNPEPKLEHIYFEKIIPAITLNPDQK